MVNTIDIRSSFLTEELVSIVNNLQGVIHNPQLLPPELQELPHWLKVKEVTGKGWKQPYFYDETYGYYAKDCDCDKRELHQWNSPQNQDTMQKVLSSAPWGKGGFHARDELHVIDFDGVIKDRVLIEPTVLRVIEYLETPVYLSSSGTGLHLPLISKNPNLEVPSKPLRFRETTGKSGEWLGANFPSFVAFTGVQLPQFSQSHIAELTDEKLEWLRKTLWKNRPSTNHTTPTISKASDRRARIPQTDVFSGI